MCAYTEEQRKLNCERTYSKKSWTTQWKYSCRRVRSSAFRDTGGATPPRCRYSETLPSSLPLTTVHQHPTVSRCWVASTRQVEPQEARNRTLQHTMPLQAENTWNESQSCRCFFIQELSYRKQMTHQLLTQYVESIYRPKYYTMTLKSRLRVTQGHCKRNHWIDHTWLSSSRVIWRWILSWPWNVG